MTKETRHVLLEIARSLIDEKGIEALTTREVGKKAGLSHTAFYRHFANKETLLSSIVADDFKKLGEKINFLESTTGNHKELLLKVLVSYYDFGMENADHYQLMFNTKWDEELYPEVKDSAEYVFNMVASIISRAMSRKSIEDKKIIEKTAIIYSFIHGLVELHLIDHNHKSKGLNDAYALIQHILEMVLKK